MFHLRNQTAKVLSKNKNSRVLRRGEHCRPTENSVHQYSALDKIPLQREQIVPRRNAYHHLSSESTYGIFRNKVGRTMNRVPDVECVCFRASFLFEISAVA